MRCIACGVEMRFLRMAPYRSMVSAGELYIFECPSCRRTEQRLAPAGTAEPVAGELMQLPSGASPMLGRFAHKVSVGARKAWLKAASRLQHGIACASTLLNDATQELLVAYNAGTRHSAVLRGRLLQACAALLTSARHNVGVARHKVPALARNAWEHTAAKWRGSPMSMSRYVVRGTGHPADKLGGDPVDPRIHLFRKKDGLPGRARQ